MQEKIANVVVIGGGPAGLMAAETIAGAGYRVDVYDAMPSVGRKFLLAGKGGMNLTHAEEKNAFLSRYSCSQTLHPALSLQLSQQMSQLSGTQSMPAVYPAILNTLLHHFDAQAVRDWAAGLGIATFVGSSGRVFPSDMKAAPLLRAWLHRMRQSGVQFHMRQRWLGWSGAYLHFQSAQSKRNDEAVHAQHVAEQFVSADAVVLALGGASWARLGSDGAWVPLLQEKAIAISALEPANCGFEVAWSEYFRQRFAGHAVTQVAARVSASSIASELSFKQGQFVMTEYGLEGSLIYALSRMIRETIKIQGSATLELDLLPDWSEHRVLQEVMHPRGSKSLSSHLKSRLKLDSFKFALLFEILGAENLQQSAELAHALKALPLKLIRPRPIDEAISSAGGICFDDLTDGLMLKKLPGVFAAGEMLDWEAPTGGYLLTACLASGKAAGLGVCDWLSQRQM